MMEWRAVVGYEGFYEVSSEGRVRSVDRITPHGRRRKSQVIRPCAVGGGYLAVQLWRDAAGSMKIVSVLVAEAFIGPRPGPHYDVCHNDGDRTNNRRPNLRYDTKSGNQADRILHDTHCMGSRHPNARLTWDAAKAIRASSESDPVLARRFGVSSKAVWLVRKGRTWKPEFTEAA